MNKFDTNRAARIRQYIDEYFLDNHKSPSVRDIAAGTGISKTAVQRYLTNMKEHREIEYNGRRSIETTLSRNMTELIPAIKYDSTVSCGSPTEPNNEQNEIIPLPTALVGEGELFILTATGDSMVDIGVDEGDLLFVKKQNSFRDGDLVIVLVNGNETTFKRIYHDGDSGFVLHAENKTYEGEELNRHVGNVRTYEERFAKEIQDNSIEEQRKAIAQKKRELDKAEKRIKELDSLFQRIYEDNLSGKISDERFAIMSASYEAEQAEKKRLAENLKSEIVTEKEQTDGLDKFIGLVKSVMAPTALTPELVHQFISRIVVHEPYRKDGKRHQDIDIYYTGVGIIYSADPEETERLFQEHLKTRKKRTDKSNEKTA